MNVKKLKSLDIIRLIITILTMVLACFILFGGLILLFKEIFYMYKNNEGSSVLLIIGIILPTYLSLCLFLAGIFGLIRYFSCRKKDISKRGFSGFGLAAAILLLCEITILQGVGIYGIIIGIISSIMGVLYFICDIIEIVQCKKERKTVALENQVNIPQTKCCAYCGNNIDSDSKFCTNCGNGVDKVVKYCSQCGNKLDSDAKFCTHCGKSVE